MDFIDQLRNFSSRALKVKDALATEDATKTSLVLPFFQLLGYDIFNPLEFVPEFVADVGIKKGEKVDYAIVIDEKPVILIECKQYGEALGKHASQLFRYFGTTSARFGILTDGITYKFFTDSNEQNKMDLDPFMIFNVLDISEHIVHELKRFAKNSLDVESAYLAAVELKYTNRIKELFHGLRAEPADSFVKYIMAEIYDGKKNQKAIEAFRPIVKRGFNQYINDNIRETLKNAMKSQSDTEEVDETVTKTPDDSTADVQKSKDSASLTPDEKRAFSIVRSILKDLCDTDRLVYRNNVSYVSVLLDGNILKRICRIWFKRKQKFITIPDENKKPVRYDISKLNDINNFADLIRGSCNRYLGNASLTVTDEDEDINESSNKELLNV